MKNSNTKKILSILLAVMMVVGMIPATAIPAYAADEATCPIAGATGTGTEEDPIIVDTFDELRLALYSSSDLFVQVDNVITCTGTIGVYSSKTLIVNGTLYGEDTVLYVDLGNEMCTFTLQGNGTIHSINGNALRALGCRKDAMKICGNLTFISGNDSAVYSDDYVTVNGGVFRTYNQEKLSLISSRGVFSGGSFPNGISLSDKIELADGCMLQYADGTVSTILQKSVSVDVVNMNYTFGFATQTPSMPDNETETFLGDYIVGTEEAKITFGFTTNPLPEALKNSGFSTTEEMTVISAKNGVVKTQNSGAAYTIDNTVADTYTVIQTITYSEGEDKYEESVTHIFTVSVHSAGYTPDPNCPIEGATGAGTEADPIIVDTFAELKAALKYDGELFVQVDGYIECFEIIEPDADKTLTVNGTLHREYGVFEVWNDNFVLQGNGKIISERGSCLDNVSSNTKIKGNLEIHSEGIGAKPTISTSGDEKLIISGGTISNLYQDSLSIGLSANVVLKEGKFTNGITTAREWEEPTLFAGSFYRYEDGVLSRTFQYGVPVEIVNVLDFAPQYPAMPEDETGLDLGVRPLGKYGVQTVSFTSKELSTELVDNGYYIEEKLTVTNPNGKVIKTQNSGDSCSVVPEIEGTYIITETLTLKDKDGNVLTTLTNTFTFTAEIMYSISARISGVPEGRPITINLYKSGEDTPFKTTTAYGQGDFDINNLPLDFAFTLTSVPNGDYVVEIVMENYVPYRRNITVNGNNVVDFFVLESYKTVVVDITGMYEAGIATVKIYQKGTDTVLHTATIKGNGSHIFAEVANGDYTVEVSATGYKTKTSNLYIYNSDNVKGVSFEMEYIPREVECSVSSLGSELFGAKITVIKDGKVIDESIELDSGVHTINIPIGDFQIVVSKNSFKPRTYEFDLDADDEFSLNAEILRWGDANLDDVLDVQDYQQTINKGLSGDHKLDGSYEQSLMDWCEDGYIDVLDCAVCVLCINGSELFSASVEYDKYYGTGGETIRIPVIADGFGVTYEWKAPEGAPAIVDGSEDEATVKIGIESGKYNIGDKFTYTCIVRDMFFSVAELEVGVEIESLNNLYAVTYSSQYEDITGLPGKTRVKAGESITIPELIPQLDGYTFKYWYAGSDRLNPGDTYTPYQNTIIMPYMAKDYEITLYSDIEGELFGTHIGNYGEYYYLPEIDVLPDGYTFEDGSRECIGKPGTRTIIKK